MRRAMPDGAALCGMQIDDYDKRVGNPSSITMRSRLAILATFVVVVSASVATTAQAQIKLGLAAPLTGPDAGFGAGLRQGAEQAVADVNRSGGVNGQKLQLTILDDAGDAKQGMASARKLAAAGIKFVLGHPNSSVAAVTMPIYDEAGILLMTPGATWAPLTARGAWNVFRLCGNDARQGALAGEWLAARYQDGPIGIVNDKTTFGRGLADEAAHALKANGGREALFEGIVRGEKDFSALVAKLKAAKVEAVYFGGVFTEGALLARAMREGGLAAPLVGSDGLLDKDFAQLAGPAAEGTLMTLALDPRRPTDSRAAGAKSLRSQEAEAFFAQSYAAVEILKKAAEATKSVEARKIADYLHSGRPVRTAIGEIAFDAKGDFVQQPFAMMGWRKTSDGRIDYAGNEVAP